MQGEERRVQRKSGKDARVGHKKWKSDVHLLWTPAAATHDTQRSGGAKKHFGGCDGSLAIKPLAAQGSDSPGKWYAEWES